MFLEQGEGEEVIGGDPGLRPHFPSPCPVEGALSSSAWQPFTAGQLGGSASNHAPDIGPF